MRNIWNNRGWSGAWRRGDRKAVRKDGKKRRIAVAMLHSGLPRDLVARLTGLTEQELTPLAD